MARRPADKPIPHNRRSIKGATMADLRRRRSRRKAAEAVRRLKAWVAA